jgi:hypothetical protein
MTQKKDQGKQEGAIRERRDPTSSSSSHPLEQHEHINNANCDSLTTTMGKDGKKKKTGQR